MAADDEFSTADSPADSNADARARDRSKVARLPVTPLVALQGITKAYPGVLANDAIDLSLEAGQIHALLGENGAGKSTLVKVMYGLLQPDAGTITWKGRVVPVRNPAEARGLGIAMVFQHFSLFESMTVLENIALGMAVDADATLSRRIVEVSTRYGLPLDPARSVHTLSVGARQRIEICRCLLQEPELLIMDEPTSVLTPQEVAELFMTLRRLASEGTAILYISHKLGEIRQLCDVATILRGGQRVATADPARESTAGLAALMMGADAAALAPGIVAPVESTDARQASTASKTDSASLSNKAARVAPDATRGEGPHVVASVDARLVVDKVSLTAGEGHAMALHAVELDVKAGEIVGIAGVAGNGQDELVRVIAGEVALDTPAAIRLDGQCIASIDAGKRRRLGLCVVPEERLGHATVPTMTLAENAFLTAHHRRPLQRAGLLSSRASRHFANEIIERFDVRCKGPSSLAASLSGGNLQKFVVGREILQAPAVLVVSQPTWGVDTGAAAVIHEALRDLARNGAAILVVSQDLDELMLLSDRIGALCAGRLSTLHPTASVNVRDVGLLMGGEALAA